MSVSDTTPKIREFPDDGRIWRIDWLGALQKNPSIPDEPTVQVIISPLVSSENLTIQDISSVKAVVNEERKSISIGVGQLPWLRIGSLWKNRRCLRHLSGTSKRGGPGSLDSF